MNRMVCTLASIGASALGWHVARPLGLFAAIVVSSIAAGAAIYAAHRILHEYLGL